MNMNEGLSARTVVPMIGYLYFQDKKNTPSPVQSDEIKGSFSIGMIAGQLLFGTLGDALGRHRVYGKECLFAIFGTLLVILLPWKGISQTGVVAWLSVFRCMTGMGTGGGTYNPQLSCVRLGTVQIGTNASIQTTQ